MTDEITSSSLWPSRLRGLDVEGGSHSPLEQDRDGTGALSLRDSTNWRNVIHRHRGMSERPNPIEMNDLDHENNARQPSVDGGPEHAISSLESSDKLWGLYLTMAQQYDREQSVNWIGDSQGILVFTGVFSGTVASFLLFSYHLLLPNKTESVISILTQISCQLAALSNNTTFPIPPTFNSSTFKPRGSSIAVNVLWAISLTLSLTSALLATLIQQWTRRYNQISRRPNDPRTQGLIHAYFANGTREHHMSFTVALLPAMVHLSVIFFFIGSTIFLFVVHQAVYFFLLITLGLLTIAYLMFTFSSFRSHSSPYQTPFTAPLWVFINAMKLSLAWLFGWSGNLGVYKDNLVGGMQATLEASAKDTFKDNELAALEWILENLRQDDQFEDYVDAIPSKLSSGEKINSEMTEALGPLLEKAVGRLLETCKGDVLSEGARKQRLNACYRTVWCLKNLSLRHTKDLLDKWRLSRRDSVKEEWDVLCFDAWKAAQQTATIRPDGRLALLAECSQALLAMMWATGRYSTTQDELEEARHILQDQFKYPPPVPERTPLIPPPSSLTFSITIEFFRRALPVIAGSDDDNPPDNIRRIFSEVAESFGQKVLGIPEGVAYGNTVPPEFREWCSQFTTLTSSFRAPDNRKSHLPYIIYSDIHWLYQFSDNVAAGPRLTDGSSLSFPFQGLRAVGVWCCVKLVRSILVDVEMLGSGGEPSRLSDSLHACWKLVAIMRRDKDRKVVFRSYCIRTMLTVEWCKATGQAASLPSGSRPDATFAMSPHIEVSERYINHTDQDTMGHNPDYLLIAANNLLDDLLDEQCIAELRDRNVAEDFEATLHHVLERYLPFTDPALVQLDPTLERQVTTEALPSGPNRDNLENALRRVRSYAEGQMLGGTVLFINKLGIIEDVPAAGTGSGSGRGVVSYLSNFLHRI